MNCCGESRDEINLRVGHIAVAYNNLILVWGGFRWEPPPIYSMSNEKNYSAKLIWIYNCLTEVWAQRETDGAVPPNTSGAVGLVHGNNFYVLGGMIQHDEFWTHTSSIFRLNLSTFSWTELFPSGQPPSPCDKSVGWIHEERLFLFGGFGRRFSEGFQNVGRREHVDFLHDARDNGNYWNNQLVYYDPAKNSWNWPETKGQQPSPRAAMAGSLKGHLMYLFGGRSGPSRLSDLYTLNMTTLKWTQLEYASADGELPMGRSWHSFTHISDHKAVMVGGLSHADTVCSNWWELDTERLVWRHHEMESGNVWHQAVFSSASGELYIFGGVNQSPYTMTPKNHVLEPMVLRFRPTTLFRLALNVIVCHHDVESVQSLASHLPDHLLSILTLRVNR